MKKMVVFIFALILPTFGVSAQTVGLNDSQIVAILIAANNAAIAAGKLAKFKSSDQENIDLFSLAEERLNDEDCKKIETEVPSKPDPIFGDHAIKNRFHSVCSQLA